MSYSSSSLCSFKEVTTDFCDTLPKAIWRHCAHIMIYANAEDDCFLFYRRNRPIKYTAIMQMRFDGRLGFPGGFIDVEDISVVAGLNREIHEEMGAVPENFIVTEDDYLTSYTFEEKKYCLHFYAKEVSFSDYLKIEKREKKDLIQDFEVLGIIRVPLYTMSDCRGGFPAFLRNNFIGHSRQELLNGIRKRKLLSDEELNKALAYSQMFDNLSNTDVTR